MDGNEVTKKEEKASKAYLYNDRVFESYDDASRACAEDGHLGSSCKEYIDEVDFVRSAQLKTKYWKEPKDRPIDL